MVFPIHCVEKMGIADKLGRRGPVGIEGTGIDSFGKIGSKTPEQVPDSGFCTAVNREVGRGSIGLHGMLFAVGLSDYSVYGGVSRWRCRRRSALVMTETDDRDIAAPAIIGL